MGERPPVLPISKITLGMTRWRTKVVVLDKTDIQTSKRGHRTQKSLLQDEEGTVVEAILWNYVITIFEHTLEVSKTYVVGEMTIQPIREEYRYMSPKMPLEWVLRSTSVIRAVTDQTYTIAYPLLHSVPHRDIIALAGTKTPIDVMVAVVGVTAPRDVTIDNKSVPVQELKVIDQSLNQFTLSLWGEYVQQKGTLIRAAIDEMPVLMCRRLLSRAYSGGSLSTVPYSYVMVTPNVPQTEHMNQWVHNNATAIKQLGQPGAITFKEINKGKMKEGVSESSTQPSDRTDEREIEGTMSILDITQEVAYCTCKRCFEVTLEYKQDRFICNKCHQNEIAQPRCRLVVLLEDHDDMMTATLFDESVEQLLHYKVDQLHCIDEDRTQMVLEKARDALQNKKVKVKVVPQTKKYFDSRTPQAIQDWKFIEAPNNNESEITANALALETTPEKRETKRKAPATETNEDDTENTPKKFKAAVGNKNQDTK